jgi:hypothetical protein
MFYATSRQVTGVRQAIGDMGRAMRDMQKGGERGGRNGEKGWDTR